jgi:REP element-mobilizing transposase RayT
MHIEPYAIDECRFAYCYHVYLRWGTHRRHACAALPRLSCTVARELAREYGIELLEWETAETEVRTLVSLRPEETVAACAGKLKGRTSKWLRRELKLAQPTALLSKGYFACTAGKSNQAAIDHYLDRQGEHHGYADRVVPPVHVRTFEDDEAVHVRAPHAFTLLRFHLVLGTWGRRGVFGQEEAQAVTEAWRAAEAGNQFTLLKVSFVPDHVHLALRAHPAVVPGALVVHLLNVAQQVIWSRFAKAAIQAGIPRLWQPGAYLGSFGDVTTSRIQQYLRNWAQAEAHPTS